MPEIQLPHTGERHATHPSAILNKNHYANKNSVTESMLDVALLMANASQLKAVLEQGPDFSLYTTLITLISVSLSLQVAVGVLLIFIETHPERLNKKMMQNQQPKTQKLFQGYPETCPTKQHPPQNHCLLTSPEPFCPGD
ncbi:hypothetical protein DPEC_G00004290 [Dallia pectoralis]|uniref:Uncharacterized protein n=1 Tax=Dallia pectoralis TaxID=75939 RepID=A0ACC2HJW0_DALPE|nr:hypothetical protein DPEC_G00004290 [Dallia pectoralis]